VARRPGLPAAVDRVMASALAKDPVERYASCLDFAGALREALGLPPFAPEGGAARPVLRSPVFRGPRPRGGTPSRWPQAGPPGPGRRRLAR
jgi:hypothetical protein